MKQVICQGCPNGCKLTLTVDQEQILHITGNRCEKGLAFARKHFGEFVVGSVPDGQLTDLKTKKVVSDEKNVAYPFETLHEVAFFWGIRLKKGLPLVMIAGSPERSEFRTVVQDEKDQFFVLEQVFKKDHVRKERIAQILNLLSSRNLKNILPYLKTSGGEFLAHHKDQAWLLSPFLKGAVFDRQQYIYEKWRAEYLFQFLHEFRAKSADLTQIEAKDVFSLKSYIYILLKNVERFRPQIRETLKPIIDFLEYRFMGIYDALPKSFCHGDYHPLNIIWGKDHVRAVIDWEFCGVKPAIYDAANMVGCLGMEHPSSLARDLVCEFLQRLNASGFFSELEREFFLEFVVALRFAWLSEWLRKVDLEMIDIEITYMKLLIDNRDALIQNWWQLSQRVGNSH